ncbi:hypothetical protein, partial [Ruegeria sp. Ofav3-42]|uniref:hypothetical protein n=1 Tax=Ruegeria sp. Ofav3-42 TaxID=2917759 RepID=UPI001EF6B7DD
IGEFSRRMGRLVGFGEGVGQNQHTALLSTLIISGRLSKLTFADRASSTGKRELRVLEFFNTMSSKQTPTIWVLLL